MRYLFTLACLLFVTATVADEPEFDFDSVAAKKAFRDYKKAVAKDEKSQAQKQKTLDEEAAKATKEIRDALVSNLKKALKKSMQAGNLEEANRIDAAIKQINANELDVQKDTPLPGDRLKTDMIMQIGSLLNSENKRFQLAMQNDGNLVLYRLSDHKALWSSNTVGKGGVACKMQGDGNFVMRNRKGSPVWATMTHIFPGANLVIQGDGNVVIYDANGRPVWATNTQGQ